MFQKFFFRWVLCEVASARFAIMPQNVPSGGVPGGQLVMVAVPAVVGLGDDDLVKPSQVLDLEAAASSERSRQASFRSLQSSQSSLRSFKSVGRFSRWGSFKSFKSGTSLASFMSARWDHDPPGGREVAMVAPVPRAPKIDVKLEKKKKNNDCTFLLILSTGILLALLATAFALGLWF